MIRYTFIKLPSGSFKALVQGHQSHGSLTAEDGYIMERTDEESLTVSVSNPTRDKGGPVHHIPWTAVEDSHVASDAAHVATKPKAAAVKAATT